MNRRNFLRSVLGVAAATALPSEVWPFRKIFLPPARYWAGTSIVKPPLLDETSIEALELEYYKKTLSDFIFRDSPFYNLLKNRTATAMLAQREEARRKIFRVPVHAHFLSEEERILRETTKELNDALLP